MKDVTGKKFGRLTVLRRSSKNSTGNYRWWCRCECGRLTRVVGGSLMSGHTVSCGCFKGWPEGYPDTRNHKGEHNGAAKLKPEQVEKIRELAGTIPQREIGALFDVVQTTVSRIVVERNWRHTL